MRIGIKCFILSLCSIVFFVSVPRSYAATSEEGEAIGATIAQIIPKLVDEQIGTIRLSGNWTSDMTFEPMFGTELANIWNNHLLGLGIHVAKGPENQSLPVVYGGVMFGQRRFNAVLGKHYIDVLLGVEDKQQGELLWVVEPRLDVVVKQTRKIFAPDLIVNNSLGIKLGASLRLAGRSDFSGIAEHSVIAINIGLFLSHYSDK